MLQLAILTSERLEQLRGRLLLFAPLCLGTGIGLYFGLDNEPDLAAWARLAGLALLALWVGRKINRTDLAGFALPFWAVSMVILGLGLAGARTAWVAGPVLNFHYYGAVEGRVVIIDRSASDAVRLTLDQVRLERVAPERVPNRVRVSLHGDQSFIDPVPGMRIGVTAFLSAPQGPVEPGGFDFRRMSWFRGIGAVGYARAPALMVEPSGRALPIQRLRRAISRAVLDEIPGEAGAFAAAITTGDRSAMGAETLEHLRASNLAHLLAISGLHMGLLVGFVFGAVRLGLALVPGLANALDTRRIAAVVALVVGAFYLALSGGAISTSRAFVMVAVMMGAIIFGRRALTLRAVAVAALILLVLKPEALVEAGFQMSFAATTALVAAFSAVRRYEFEHVPKWLRPVFAVVFSSLIAGLATAPYAAAIFNRVAYYGLLANVLSVPVMGILVMPLAALAALLSPLGLSWIALDLMRWPIEWILAVAAYVAELDGAVGYVVAPQSFVVPVITLGGLALILLRGSGRAVGLAAVVAALGLWTQVERPDVLIASSGRLMGVMGEEGRVLNKPKGDGFSARSWLENDGDGAAQPDAAARAGAMAVPITLVAGRGMSERLAPACGAGGLVVTPAKDVEVQGPCVLIDAEVLAKTGALALYAEGAGLRVVTVAERAGKRPWTGATRKNEKRPEIFPDLSKILSEPRLAAQ